MVALINYSENTPVFTSKSAHSVSLPVDANTTTEMVIPNDMPRIDSLGFSHRCAELRPIHLNLRQTFLNPTEFQNAMYLMSLAGKF